MACDSAWSDESGTIQTYANKITRLKSGALLGESGDNDSRHVQQLLANVKSFAKMPMSKELGELKIDYTGLIVFPNGEIAKINVSHEAHERGWCGQAWKVNRGVAACGSGGDIALGCMSAGKSAREAVALACRFDPHSRLPVHVVPLIKPARTSAKA